MKTQREMDMASLAAKRKLREQIDRFRVYYFGNRMLQQYIPPQSVTPSQEETGQMTGEVGQELEV